jgi:NAD(P)-dependent dehydrogenase (short-subunit alcohol dehydrogenase family)
MAERVVCISGATGGLGRAAVRAFAADGHRVGLLGTSAARLQDVATDLGLADDGWAPGVGDLRDRASAHAAITAVADRLGPIDILVHLVGGWTGGTPLAELDPATLDDMLGQHVWSTFHVAGAVVPPMVERGWGRIVAITAAATIEPTAKSSAYLAAKAAQETMLRGLAREVASAGVTVNVLAVKAIDEEHRREREPSAKTASWTTPEEIVAAIRFLCSDEAAAITGARIPLSGR